MVLDELSIEIDSKILPKYCKKSRCKYGVKANTKMAWGRR